MENDVMNILSGILSDPETKENLINSLTGISGGRNTQLPATPPSFSPENMAFILKIQNMLEKLNNTNDSRIGLLNSIRPFMRNGKQRNIDTAIKFIQIMNFASGR